MHDGDMFGQDGDADHEPDVGGEARGARAVDGQLEEFHGRRDNVRSP